MRIQSTELRIVHANFQYRIYSNKCPIPAVQAQSEVRGASIPCFVMFAFALYIFCLVEAK